MKPVSQKDDIVVSLEIYLGSFQIKIFFLYNTWHLCNKRSVGLVA